MKKLSILASLVITAIFALSTALCSAQDSIQYQLVIRNAAGQLITNKQVNMKFSLVGGGQSFYEETQKTTTDKYGNISVFIGTGTAVKGAMKDVPWSTMDISLKVESDTEGGDKFKELGTVPIAAAPYAMYAATAGSNANNGSPKDDEALFEVCDRDGQPVFAVYNSGIVVYVDESNPKAARSGLVVTGRTASKGGQPADYFAVDAEGTHIYVDDAEESRSKTPRSGLIVTGRSASKSATTDEKHIADDRTATKADGVDMFAVNGGLTTVYVDDTDNGDKTPRSGFVVTGRTASKADKKAIEITGVRTDIKTGTLSISNTNADAATSSEITEAPAAALQLSDKGIGLQNDMVIDGGLRPAAVVKKTDDFDIYLSDEDASENDGRVKDNPVVYKFEDTYGDFYIPFWRVFDDYDYYSYTRLAAFHDTLCVPLKSPSAILMLNSKGEETTILKEAVVAISYETYGCQIFPITELDGFQFSFAISDYIQTSQYLGKATKHARFNVTLKSTALFAGCELQLCSRGEIYSAKVSTATDGTVETEITSDKYFRAAFGETVTLAVTEVPEGRVFGGWRSQTLDDEGNSSAIRSYADSVLNLAVTEPDMLIWPVFKDESPVVYVDGTYDDGISDGTKAKPFSNIADALTALADSCAKDIVKRGYRIQVITDEWVYDAVTIESDANLNKAKYITINLNSNRIDSLKVMTTAPVIVKDGTILYAPSDEDASALVNLSGTKLTLENCSVFCDGDEITPLGAIVNSGELLLINTSISGFKQSGVYVASGATLTVNGDSENMVICENSAEQGGGIYVADGGTLNIKGGWIANNSAKQGGGIYVADGATLNIKGGWFSNESPAGANIYLAGENAVFNLYGSIESSIGGIGLADGAAVTAVGNYPANRGDFQDEIWPIAYFDYIAKPENENQIVKLGADVQPYDLSIIRQYFGITNRNLIAEGYDLSLGADGKPYKYKTVYATGKIELTWENTDQNHVYTNVNYTYYRNSDNNEYLYLKYDWNNRGESNDYREYRNYWIVDGKIYGDTIYVKTKDTPAQPIQRDIFSNLFNNYQWKEDWENVYIGETDDAYVNLLSCPQDNEYVINNYNYYVQMYHPSSQYYDCADIENSVVIDCGKNFFKKNSNLAVFKSLIEPSVSIAGRGKTFNDYYFSNCLWDGYNAYTLANNDVSTASILEKENGRSGFYIDGEAVLATTEKKVFEYKGELRKQTLAEIDEMFDKLQDGFTVTVDATPGGTVQFGDFDPNPDNAVYKVAYGTNNVLTAIPDEGCVFIGWSDGVTSAERLVSVYSDINLTANFAKEYYVDQNSTVQEGSERDGSANKPFTSIDQAVGAMNNNYCYVINVKGNLTNPQSIGGTFTAKEIIIKGKQGNTQEPMINIPSGTTGTALTINTTVPVTVENLTISGGNGANNGGGIYCGAGSNVTLDNGTKVTGNTAKSKGGGVYVDSNGKLTINNGAEVSNNNVVGTNWNGDEGGSAMYINHGEVLMNGGEISNNYSHETGNENDYNNYGLNSRGGIRLECAKFTLKDGKITGNKSGHLGGNIFSVESQIDICGGEISNGVIGYRGSSSDACGSALFLDINSVLNMSGGKIIGNKSLASSSMTGSGAIVVRSSIFNMSGGTISGNTIESGGTKLGSAVCVEVTSQFNISDSAYIALDNDVSLEYVLKEGQEKRAKINIVGPLDSAMVANVTVQNCIDGVQVLTLADGDEAALAAACCKFNLRNRDAILSYDGTVKMINETTQKYEFPVNTANQYKYLFDLLNANTKIETDSVYISIENDLTLNGFKPYDPGNEIAFKGVFDGKGHTLTIESINKDKFMVICWKNEGFIQNVKVNVANQSTVVCGKSGSQYPAGFSGGICHANHGSIINCWSDVSADVTFTSPIGGICTHNYSAIENCLNTGNITGTYAAGNQAGEYGVVGGICGANRGTITNCVNYGTISMPTTYNESNGLNGIPGAICGGLYDNTSSCVNCYWRQNCVVNGSNTNNSNNMVYNDSRMRNGSASGCGYFTDYTNGSLSAGTTETCGGSEGQSLQYGTNLLNALNGYVGTEITVLKRWKADDNHAAVLDFGN